MDQFKSITYETTGRIARITLNRLSAAMASRWTCQTRLRPASNART